MLGTSAPATSWLSGPAGRRSPLMSVVGSPGCQRAAVRRAGGGVVRVRSPALKSANQAGRLALAAVNEDTGSTAQLRSVSCRVASTEFRTETVEESAHAMTLA